MRTKKQTSQYISYLLRHHPEDIGMCLDEHGWADVETLIAGIGKTQEFTMEQLEEIVASDEKQRYAFNEDHTLIRANQGHSIPVDVQLERVSPPDMLYHGTAEKYVDSILTKGLCKQSRLYVHLSVEKQTAIAVGKRHGKPVVFQIDAKRMVQDGYVFYLSRNQVYLTDSVPVCYLTRIDSVS